jgi:branched-chain amino acid transport system permease protein
LWTINLVAAGIAPFLLDAGALRDAHRVLALAVIFISIVCITGFSGHITLGQSSIAGAGAFFAARAANAWHLPVIIAMLVGASAAMFIGVLVGFPALRRKGIFLGLTTLGLALLINAFVFNEELLQGGPGGLTVRRPHLFGIDLTGDIRFYFYEYAVLCIVLLIAGNLRSGRLGRVLAAMRDSETAAQSVGIGLRRAKLFVFAVSSAMAGIGGALLTQADQNWDPVTFFPLFGLFWFTAVVVCGVSSLGGATVAAIIYVMLPSLTGQDLQSAIGLFGLGALALGWFPGGAAAQLPRIAQRLRRRLAAEYRAASQPPPEPPRPHELTPFAKRVLGDAGLR